MKVVTFSGPGTLPVDTRGKRLREAGIGAMGG
jgi:hypothetical protein